MDEYIKNLRIEKVRNAFENGKVSSIEFYKDGSGAYFYYIDPTGDHGLPCDVASSFPMEDVIKIVSGFRMKQHEFTKCL